MSCSRKGWFFLTIFLLGSQLSSTLAANNFENQRQKMIKLIETDVKETSRYLNKKILDPRVLTAMGRVPRHEFVLPQDRRFAYQNRPLSIGQGQTISQPYIVAIMTDLISPKSDSKVLEVGTGSGYQAAVLAELTEQVYSIEIINSLASQATERLARLGYRNIQVKQGDGYYGWQEHAPFDAIVVTAAVSHVPPPLVKQLKVGGKMIIPVGSRFMTQELLLITKRTEEDLITQQILPVLFVPLTGKH